MLKKIECFIQPFKLDSVKDALITRQGRVPRTSVRGFLRVPGMGAC